VGFPEKNQVGGVRIQSGKKSGEGEEFVRNSAVDFHYFLFKAIFYLGFIKVLLS
jgi:hypothetical protein